MKQAEYNPNHLKSFDDEWLLHKKCSEWWYSTSILRNEENNLYSCQYTFLKMRLLPCLKPYVLMTAVTDFQTGKHYYAQSFSLSEKDITIDENNAVCKGASVHKGEKEMKISCSGNGFSFDLCLDYGKGAYWHCDGGKLYMGVEDEKQTTLYYSYTNMPTRGIIRLNGKELSVSGSTWFDKQGGTFKFMDIHTHWEWFSMRFYDGEEIMLFNFPQQNYADGTYITKDREGLRLNNYSMKPIGFVEKNGWKFSCGWELSMPGVKSENYKIVPIIEGQMNLAYFEQLCYIYDESGEEVGMSFVELLPGVYNKKLNGLLLLKKV